MLAVAFGADRLFGDPQRFHPVAGFGRIATALERALWRDARAAGAVHAALCVAGAFFAARRLPRAAVVWATLGGLSLERAALALASALREGDLDRARTLAPTLVGRDPSALDERELARAAIESVAENTSDAVVAPLLWGALLGAPGAAAYRAVNTLDAMVGHKDERYRNFGWAAARLDDVANWAPARLTALLAAACSPGRRRASLAAAFGDAARAHPSPNAGRVEGAFAGALGLRLGGVNRYRHGLEHRPVMGDGPAPEVADVERAARLARAVSLAALAVCLVVARRA